VTVIPNAVDIDKFPLGNPPDEALKASLGLSGARVLGFIGSFYAYEGLDLLLQALPNILAQASDVRVLLVGGGPQEANLKRQAATLCALNFLASVSNANCKAIRRWKCCAATTPMRPTTTRFPACSTWT
jgi:glycosyltransferase involved in cell wall biosynthesis